MQLRTLQCIKDEVPTMFTFQNSWYEMLPGYTQGELSHYDDRLSALAGIAQLFYRRSSYEASYGLWVTFLLDQLPWTGTVEDINDLTTPSWSWAGTRGRVINENSQNHEDRVFHGWANRQDLHTTKVLELSPMTGFCSLSLLYQQIKQPPNIKLRSYIGACVPIPIFHESGGFIM